MDGKKLSHFNDHGEAHMVDIGSKTITKRKAVASGKIFMNQKTFDIILAGKINKGDVLSVARLAAIQGAKQTSFLIPLCHSISIAYVNVEFKSCSSALSIELIVTCLSEGKTGVEMEALTATSIGLLTIYDMAKSVDKDMRIGEIGLILKEGGNSGKWEKPQSYDG